MKRKEDDVSNEIERKKKKENLDLQHIEHLPYCIKSNIETEIITWKKEIFEGLKTTLEKKNNKGDPPNLVRIQRFLDLKYPFTKTEKEEITKMMYEILTFPNIDMDLQTKYARVLCSLLKKKEDLNLNLPWKPLYQILDKLYFSKYRRATYTPKDHGNTLVRLIKKLKRYFDVNATDEILEELRPYLSLNDHIIFKAQGYLTLFLPTNTSRSDWIDECMEMFSWVGLYPTYDCGFTSLFSSLCKESKGSLNFEKHLNFLFSKFLKFFDIPIGNSPQNIYEEFPAEECSLFLSFELSKSLLMTDMAKLIVWLISPKSETFGYFQKLLKSIEFYFHPSNEGPWTQHLGDFLLILCNKFVKRVKKEKAMEKKEDYHITEEIQKNFVKEILPIVFTSVYSKSPQMTVCGNHSLKHLCYLAPEIVFPPLIERYFHALTTLTETHQTISVLESLSIVIFPLLQYKENHIYLNDLISLTLPGIDVNDMRKTYSTIKFYITVLMNIPLIESKSKDAPEITFYYEEWCLQILDRVITIISNQGPSQKDNPEGIPNSTFSTMFDILFNQVSSSIYQICLKKVFNFVSKEFSINGKKNIGHLCNSLVYANPESALQLFVPMCYDNLISKNQLRDLTSNEIEWYLHILSQVVCRAGKSILKFKKELWTVISLTWNHSEKLITKSSGKLIKNLLKCLSFYYPLEIKSSNPMEWNSKSFQESHWESWGKFTPIEDLYVQYHVPSEEEIAFSVEIINHYMDLLITCLNEYSKELTSKKKTSMTTKEAKNRLTYLRNLMKGSSNIIPEISKDIIPNYSKFQDTVRISAATCFVDEKLLKYNYYHISQLCHELIVAIGNNETFSEVLSTLPKIIYPIFSIRGGTTSVSHSKEKSRLKFAKLSFFKSGHKSEEDVKYPRYFQIKKIQLEVFFRYVVHNDSIEYTKSHEILFKDLIVLSYSNYSIVRKKAQNILVSCLKRFPIRVTQIFIPDIINTMSNPQSTEDETTGAIYILEKLLQRTIIPYPTLTLSLMLNLTKTYHVKKQSTQDRIMELFESLFHLFYQFPIESQEVLNQFANEIFEVVENNRLHWKYLLTVGTCFLLLVRSDGVRLPNKVTEFVMNNLTSDIEKLRSLSYETMNLILCQYKPVQPRKFVDLKNQTLIDKWTEMKAPTNEKEWNETLFFDKNYVGWNLCHPKTQFYIYNSESPKIDSEILKLRSMFTTDFLDKFFELFVIREDTFSETNAQTFKGFVQVFKEDFIEAVKPYLNDLIVEAGSGQREEIFFMSSAAELVGGIIRGIKHWSWNSQKKVVEYLISQVFEVLDKCSVACIDEWCQCIEFCSSDRDPRRLVWFKDYLFSKFEKSISNETSQARYLKYYYSYFDSIYWRDPNNTKQMISVLKNYIHHPYEQVREIISLFLSSIFKSHWKPPRDSKTNLIVYKDLEYDIDLVDDFMKELNSQFYSYQDNLKEDQVFLSLSKIILSTFFNTFVSHVPCLALKYLNEIISMHCMIQENSDEEVQNSVKGNLFFIASFPFNEKYTIKTFKFISNVLKTNKQWRVKTTLLQFLQIFGFKQQYYLKEYQDEIFELLVELLKDSQFEVRELACETLAGFFKFSSMKMIHKYYQEFKKSVSKKQKNQIRYGAILGISAIIKAFPYDIPEFMPSILVEFASYSHEEHQISDVVRKTFSEFWRLHSDTWHIEKKKLTEDQLLILTDQLISPSYYA